MIPKALQLLLFSCLGHIHFYAVSTADLSAEVTVLAIKAQV